MAEERSDEHKALDTEYEAQDDHLASTYDTIDKILKGLELGQIAFDQAIRMILALKAQGKLSDEELYVKTKGLIVEGRSLVDQLGNVSLQEEGEV